MLNPIGTWTLFKRETKRYLKVYLQTVLSPLVSNLLYLAVFGVSLHRAIPEIGGITYLAFLVPGLICMGIMNNAFQNPSSSLMIAKYTGVIADLLMIPLKKAEILFAILASAIIRGLLVGSITLITMSFFVDLPYHSIPIVIGAALLIALFFSSLGLIVGVWAKEFDNFALIQSFILTPLTFLGGVFYPIQNLPESFALVSKANPIVYMVDLIRYGFTGVNAIAPLTSFTVISVMAIATTWIAYLILKSGWRLQT